MIRSAMIGAVILILLAPLFAEEARELSEAGLSAFQQEDWPGAVQAFEKALERDPADPALHFALGAARYRQEDFEGAGKAFQQAVQLGAEPRLREGAWYNLGNALYRQEQFEQAIEAYKEALRIDPADRDAKHNLEMARARLEQNEQDQEQDQNDDQNQQLEPSAFARQLKGQADLLVSQRFYRQAVELMEKGLRSDETVGAYNDYIERLRGVVTIEEETP